MSTRQRVLRAHEALLNGSGKLSYFHERGIAEEVVKRAYVGYESGAFLYPCIGRSGGLLVSTTRANPETNKESVSSGGAATPKICRQRDVARGRTIRLR